MMPKKQREIVRLSKTDYPTQNLAQAKVDAMHPDAVKVTWFDVGDVWKAAVDF